jgi:hypothetical protein
MNGVDAVICKVSTDALKMVGARLGIDHQVGCRSYVDLKTTVIYKHLKVQLVQCLLHPGVQYGSYSDSSHLGYYQAEKTSVSLNDSKD